MKVFETRCLEVTLTPEERETLKKAANIVGEVYEEMCSNCYFEISGNQTDYCRNDFENTADILRDWAEADTLKAEE
jgi:hypothetical protein